MEKFEIEAARIANDYANTFAGFSGDDAMKFKNKLLEFLNVEEVGASYQSGYDQGFEDGEDTCEECEECEDCSGA